MNWPPVKSWTRKVPINGMSHFVAINYGITEGIRWVNLVSVLDGNLCIQVKFKHLSNIEIWLEGWHSINLDSVKGIEKKYRFEEYMNMKACLHASDDSGLAIPVSSNIRPW